MRSLNLLYQLDHQALYVFQGAKRISASFLRQRIQSLLDTCIQLWYAKRLADDIIHAGLERHLNLFRPHVGCDCDDGNMTLYDALLLEFSDAAHACQSIHHLHHKLAS